VGDQQHRSLRGELAHLLEERALGPRVQGRGRLVEDQEAAAA
jgi:hypothetical protein